MGYQIFVLIFSSHILCIMLWHCDIILNKKLYILNTTALNMVITNLTYILPFHIKYTYIDSSTIKEYFPFIFYPALFYFLHSTSLKIICIRVWKKFWQTVDKYLNTSDNVCIGVSDTETTGATDEISQPISVRSVTYHLIHCKYKGQMNAL